MAEAEETGAAAITDWRSLISSSPTGFFSECLGSPSRSFSQFLNGSDSNSPSPPLAAAEKESDGGDTSVSAGFDAPMEVFGDWKPQGARNVGGSIAERRAARCGFTAPRINTARFRSVSPLASPGQHSPYLTIPPGISPTTLLDSPIMLPNSQALPSPTTGTFPLPSFSNESPIPMCVASDTDKDKSEDVDSAFTFKPHGSPVSLPVHPSGENQVENAFDKDRAMLSLERPDFSREVSSTSCQAQQFGMGDVNCQPMAPMQLQMDFECETGTTNSYSSNSFSDVAGSNTLIANAKYTTAHPCLLGITDEAPQEHEDLAPPKEEAGSQLPLEEDQKGGCPSMGTGKPSEDGYNWRKYGQKQVKGSEYPRSYYKCTHPNCQVKKKVERSLDGQITEIIYKGAHNHSKPQTNRRSAVGSAFPQGEISESIDGPGQYVRTEGGSIWRGFQQGSKDKCGSDWRVDGSERTASTSVVTEVSEPFSAAQGKEMNIIESADTPERSSTLASHNDDEDGATQGSMSLGDDGEDEESESKRRKKESCMIESNLASRSVRESRVVVQTDSEVDILDDGYRWRKYGQKVVKGNPNPRSYYKCTNAGCTVRKHVERASHNLKSVITTYEGKHNHEVPAARNSNHLNLGSGNTHPSSNTQTAQTLSAPANIPKPEPQVLDLAPHFDRKPELSTEYLKLGYLGRFTADRTLGASSSYNLKLPPALQPPISLASFGHCDLHAAPAFQAVPDFPLSFPSMGLPRSTSLPATGFDYNHGKLIRASHPFIGQQSKENSLRFLRPKQEEKNDGIYEVQLPLGGPLENASYHHIMGGFPM